MSKRRDLSQSVRAIEEEIGVQPGFLEGLYDEPNDWSFVVKVHALTEAALTHAITETLGRRELREPIGYLNIGDSRAGKLVFAHKLGILNDASVAFLRALSTMRNRFVHGVEHINLRIEEYSRTLKPNADQFWRSLAAGFSSGAEISFAGGRVVPIRDFAENNPKLMVFLSAMNTIALMDLAKQTEHAKRDRTRRLLESHEKLVKRLEDLAAAAQTPPPGDRPA